MLKHLQKAINHLTEGEARALQRIISSNKRRATNT